jgi:putative DNA primase/helicase
MTTEVDEGSHLSEALVKNMTGEDPISARALYGEPFDFIPTFKLFIAGNHKPVIRGGDEGIWRRIHMIPFEVTIPPEQRDLELGEKLRAELPGILNWALAGCRAWSAGGLKAPPAVMIAVAEYKDDMDLLGQWIAACCDIGSELAIASTLAYMSYQGWANTSGLKPWSHVVFGRKLKERFPCSRHSTGVVYTGVGMKNPYVLPQEKAEPLV